MDETSRKRARFRRSGGERGRGTPILFNRYFLSKCHVPDTMVNSRDIGMNISVLVPAFVEPGERGECCTDEHVVTKHGKCCEGETRCDEKCEMEDVVEISGVQVSFLSEGETPRLRHLAKVLRLRFGLE